MGIATSALKFLLEEGIREPWNGNLLTLGRQDIGFNAEVLTMAAQQVAYQLVDSGVPVLSDKSGDANKGYVNDEWCFRRLGFKSVSVLDTSNYEQATIVHDLNQPDPPPGLEGNYDLVLDAGTIEHVFNVPNALRTLCRLTRIGGRIVHISPVSNCLDHGFYSFSPTLFADFYGINRFDISRIVVARFSKDPVSENWTFLEYDPSAWGTIGILDSGVYFLLACVKRTAQSTWEQTPQQAYYVQHAWKQGASTRRS